ncbi:DUF177 domain-containing protein [bacterium]|nr:MAG: DUF177 domain-containing protein [bacterium]
MKINTAQIPPEGLAFQEEIDPSGLELDSEVIRLQDPIKVSAEVSKITNTVTVNLSLQGIMRIICVRCLDEFRSGLEKNLRFVYEVDKANPFIDLAPQIREEIIIDYPLKPLCKEDCRGLCLKCGKNLNEGGCSCGTTKKKTL